MKIDCVFSGGGVKAYAFLGSLEVMERKELKLERVAGTSAGAIIASLLAAGYNTNEIRLKLDELDLKKFLDPPLLTKWLPFSKWFFLYFQLGINKGDKLENWLYDQLAEKNVYTFNDLPKDYLKVVVSDLTLGKLVVLPDDLERVYGLDPLLFPVAKAIRMSAGFPYFFMPKKLPGKRNTKSIIVDGGLLSNFPLWIFDKHREKQERPILGVKLSESVEKIEPRKIRNALDMFQALFSTMKMAHDTRYISKSQERNIIFIPVEGIETMNLSISEETKEKLIIKGRNSAELFLQNWPN
ncbi:patatin-like phospholipase family protein [Oceanobacillus manasiensis]|uniref:patatin-like phospholipase family protein n=1 Tax=Oceanobacillus manasiensis TaxID=586413 RepID=UPI0005AA42C3|nr:patatin-like phospholipase family protein [Oceanobacillus manasiensis]